MPPRPARRPAETTLYLSALYLALYLAATPTLRTYVVPSPLPTHHPPQNPHPTHTRCILHISQTCHRASASSAEPPTDIDAKPPADAAESGAEAQVAAVRVQVEAAVDAAPERPQPREDLACLVGLG